MLNFFCFAGSGVGSRVGVLSNIFTGKNLLLNILRTFSLALNNKPEFFLKNLFQSFFLPLSKFFVLAVKLLCSPSIYFNYKYASFISLMKQ